MTRIQLGLAILFVTAYASFAIDANWNNPPGPVQTGLVHSTFNSAAVGGAVGFNIYLPPNYAAESVSYPVIYHMHGSGGYENHETFLANTIQNNISNGKLPKMIMVFANGYNDSFYGNSAAGASKFRPVEKTVIHELISHVEDTYRVLKGRNYRAMQGFSMGGQGSNLYGHKYPDLFCSVVNFASGCRDWYSMVGSWNGTITSIYANQRYSYEPYDSWYWVNVNQAALRNGPKMRSVVGTSDHLYTNNLDFMRNTCSLDLPVQFIIPTGVGHDINQYYNYVLPNGETLGVDTMQFHAKAFAQSATPRFTGSFNQTALQGQAFSYQAQASNGPITAWGALGLPTGLSIDSSGLISGTVTGGTGVYYVNLSATSAADTGYATLILNVVAANPPVLIKSQDYTIARVGFPFQYSLLLDKPMPLGGPAITYSATGLPTWLTLNPTTGVLSGTPTMATTYSITFTATNGSTTNNQTHTLYVGTNTAPTIANAAAATGSAFTRALKVLGDDNAGEPNLTYTWSATGTPTPVFTPNTTNTAKRADAVFSRPGSYTLTATVMDQDGLSATSSTSVSIPNTAPSDIALAGATVAENSAQNTVVGSLSTTDADLPNDAHSYSLTDDAGGRFAISGNQLVVGATGIDYEVFQQHSVTVVSTDANGATTSKTLVIAVTDVLDGLTPVITWANPADIDYLTALSGTQLNAIADTPGTFTYTPALGTVLNAGNSQVLSVLFTPTDTTTYISTTKTVSINVLPLTTTVVFAPPIPTIPYGTALNSTDHLVANAPSPIDGSDLAGVFTFTPPAGTVLDVGTQTLNVSFDPTDSNFANATGSAQIEVVKAQPVITWNAPDAIVYSTPLIATQLNATANVPGTFVYTPPLATVLAAGNAQTLQCTFTPQDGVRYETAQGSVTIDVLKATPVIAWSNPLNIDYGTPLSATQLNATTGIPGNFEYTPDGGFTLNAGLNQTLSVSFTPTDSANYVSASKSVSINVLQLTPTVTFTPSATTFTYGTALNVTDHLIASATSQLNGANLSGTFTFSSSVGTVLYAGANTVTATFTPVDSNFTSTGSASANFTVSKAPLAIAAVNMSKIAGQSNPTLSATYTGFVNGDSVASLDTPVTLTTTATQNSVPGTYPIAASGAVDANYIIAFAAGALTVTNTVPVFSSPAVTFTPVAPTTGQAVQFQAIATDADGQALSFTWNFGDATNGSGTPVSHTFAAPGTYFVQCNVTDGYGGTQTTSVNVTVTAPATPPFPGVKINFQPAGSPVPAGYLADTGAVFGARGSGQSYGWNLNNASTARDRNSPASADQRYDTLQHMQLAVNPNAFWEIQIPNGSYLVTLVSGDPSHIDSKYKIQAENALILSGTPTSTKRWFTASSVVTVVDGRLTLRNATGSVNNKICFVDISATQTAALSRNLDDVDDVPDLLPMSVEKFGSSLNFTKSGNDSLKLSLKLPDLAEDFKPEGQMLDIDAMGAVYSFTLAKGRGRSDSSSVLMKYDKAAAAWTIQVTLSRAKLGEAWVDASLIKETKSANLPFAVAVKINGQLFGGDRAAVYSNKNGKTGKMN